ncbi:MULTISPECIES: hypothetical protein [Methylotenera]|uniref:hypothetical protein n=1 Tax=Methylotenera TaxID=359407 RepID=UPI000375E34C|nr:MULTISPECIES: hypothetical protein [Methylotenera]
MIDSVGIASIQKRLKAVLFYDGVAENEMHFHLAKLMGVSAPIAKRMLEGNHRTILRRGIEACITLNVSVDWLYFGRLDYHHCKITLLRTMRINMQEYKGYPKEITDKAMRFNFAFIAGMTKAKNLMNLVETEKINYIEAVSHF